MVDTVLATTAMESPRRIITWTSVLSGWLVALGFAWLFYVLGIAIGFSAFDASSPEATARGMGIGTAVWVVLTWAVSLFLGGMFASWVDGRQDSNAGTLHGVAVWGVATAATMLLAAMGFTNLLQGAGSLIGGASAAAASAATKESTRADTPLSHATGLLAAQVKRATLQSGPGSAAGNTAGPASGTTPTGSSGTSAMPDGSSAVALDLLRGNANDAKARLMADTGMQSADADRVVQSLAPQVDAYKARIKEAAERARAYTAAAMWVVFLTSVIALIAAALGGALGAGSVHRVHDYRP